MELKTKMAWSSQWIEKKPFIKSNMPSPSPKSHRKGKDRERIPQHSKSYIRETTANTILNEKSLK